MKGVKKAMRKFQIQLDALSSMVSQASLAWHERVSRSAQMYDNPSELSRVGDEAEARFVHLALPGATT